MSQYKLDVFFPRKEDIGGGILFQANEAWDFVSLVSQLFHYLLRANGTRKEYLSWHNCFLTITTYMSTYPSERNCIVTEGATRYEPAFGQLLLPALLETAAIFDAWGHL